MFHSNNLIKLLGTIVLSFSAAIGLGQNSSSNPSGTWRWTYELNGGTQEDALSLFVEDGKLTGSFLGASGKPVSIKNAKFKENQFSCDAEYSHDGQMISLAFAGKAKNDEVDGSLAVTVEGGTQEFGWTPKRSVRPEDVVGKWNIVIETDDRKLEPSIVIQQQDKALRGKYTVAEGLVVDATDLKIHENKLEFHIDTTYDGRKIEATFSGRPYGRSIQGKIKYKLDGEEGEVDFSAKLQPEKK
jgi:hypothetical protein